jgi:undecaprenyl-diphosphatase
MPFDIQICLTLNKIRNPIFTKIFLLMTQFGEEFILLPLMCLDYWCFNKRLACFAALNFFMCSISQSCFKNHLLVNRPWIRNTQLSPVPDALDSATGFSFTSGHTANACIDLRFCTFMVSQTHLDCDFKWRVSFF